MARKREKVKVRVSFWPMEQVQSDCLLWAEEIKRDFQPDAIVFLEKSGFLFAKPLSEALGCPMYSVKVARPDSGAKDAVRERVPWAPRWLMALALSSRALYGYNDENSERELEANSRFDAAPWDSMGKILIVDDSVDTGWSVLAVKRLVEELAPNACVRIASYCVIDYSLSRVHVDYARRNNAIVMSATSRYSPEYQGFLDELTAWKHGEAS